MSILIHMEMPKDGECIVIQSDGTAYKYNPGDVVMYGDAYNETADAIELHPHGRLIDADKIGKSVKAQPEIVRKWGIDGLTEIADILEKGFLQEIENADSIIPAEGGAEG